MAHLVYVVHGLRGSLYGSLAFGRRLAADGHAVTFVGFRDLAVDVEAAGFAFVRLEDGPRADAELRTRVDRVGTMRAIPRSLQLRRQVIRSTELGRTVDALRPDLLIIDAEMHVAVLGTRRTGIPTLLAVPWFSPFRAPGLPPMHTDLLPATGRVGQARIAIAWQRLVLARGVNRTLGRLRPKALRERIRPFQLNSPSITNVRAVAAFHGVALDEVASWRHWVEPLVYPALPYVSFTATEMDFPHEIRPTVHAVGPMIDEQRVEPLVSDETRQRWERFRVEMTAQGRRIVYTSMGSLQPASAAFYGGIVEAVAARDDLALVIGLGTRGDPSLLGDTPAHVLALDYAPQLDVLRAAAVAIHHGGIGTIHECVRFAVPSIVCSSGFVDEPGSAARVRYHGLGVSVTRDVLSAARLTGLLDRVLADRRIADNLVAMRTVFDRYDSERTGERLVASMLASGG